MHGLKLTQNLYTLVAMKDLMKTLLPLLGTEKTEENMLTHNFRNDFQQQKKNISIKMLGLKLTQNLYTLVALKDLMKTLLPLLGTKKTEENMLTHNFRNDFQQQKKNISIKMLGLKLTQNLYTLVALKDLMKTLLPLLGTKKTEENMLTHNFRNDFQQQKKNISIKMHGLKLSQSLYTLDGMKYLMKTLLPLLDTEKNRTSSFNT